jgi:hypothetical protein
MVAVVVVVAIVMMGFLELFGIFLFHHKTQPVGIVLFN